MVGLYKGQFVNHFAINFLLHLQISGLDNMVKLWTAGSSSGFV